MGRDAENNEFTYVWKVCEGKVHPDAILNLLSVPEFAEELRKFKGEINIQVLYEIAEKIRTEYNAQMSNDEFRQNFISEQGESAWRGLRYKYNLLTDGCRSFKKCNAKYMPTHGKKECPRRII